MSNIRTTRVKSIRKGSKKRVYDVGVEKNHNFIANGHVVSNCFQEQFMTLAVELAGFSPGESDKLRKTLVKKSLDTMGKKGGEREEAKQKFVKGAKELHGIDEAITTKLWKTIEAFSVYGFNKSLQHSESLYTYSSSNGENKTLKAIKDVCSGDFILSRDEQTGQDVFVEVIDNHDHGVIPVYEFKLDNGVVVKCTMDHKFRITDGRMCPMWQILEEKLDIVVSADQTIRH